MAPSQTPTSALLEELDGPVLVALGNWLAESLEVSELTNEQAMLLFVLAERFTVALWRDFGVVLLPLLLGAIERNGLGEDDLEEPEQDPDT